MIDPGEWRTVAQDAAVARDRARLARRQARETVARSEKLRRRIDETRTR